MTTTTDNDHYNHEPLTLPKFEYQPALPIPNGKTCLWLFLSTEIMFFAGLIGTYIVLRFGAVAWPAPHDVHLSEPIGAFNTFVLICSSVTVVLALEAAKLNQAAKAKGWILLTFLLGLRVPGRQGVRVLAKVRARHLSAAAARPGLRQGRRLLRGRRPQAAQRSEDRDHELDGAGTDPNERQEPRDRTSSTASSATWSTTAETGDPQRARFAGGPHQAHGAGVRDLSAARPWQRACTRPTPAPCRQRPSSDTPRFSSLLPASSLQRARRRRTCAGDSTPAWHARRLQRRNIPGSGCRS